ncbi:MAG: xanthine dehydrogenase family protein subunit M [Fimbriimonadaceae bacterium]|nr:xanthine dehydrogenase family protein subunit M [Alphaproteobacteria bacterium]
MILYDFEYERPDSLEEVVTRLGELGTSAKVLAGGSDLLPNMRLKIQKPHTLVSLNAITPEPPIVETDRSIRIHALTRLHEIETSALLLSELPMLSESAHQVGSNQIRQMGTLGGNLCQEIRCLYLNQEHDFQFVAPCYKRGGDCCYPYPNNSSDICASVFMSDIAPALIALDARIEILGEDGLRAVCTEDFYTGNGLKPVDISPSELVGAVIVPPPPPLSGWGYHKSTIRGGLEFAMCVVAVRLSLEDDRQTCADVRISIGAVSEGPSRPKGAEDILRGSILDEESIADVAMAAIEETRFLPHHNFTVEYLRENARVYLRRVLAEAFERAKTGSD